MTYPASLPSTLTTEQANATASILTQAATWINGTHHDHDPASVTHVQAAIYAAATYETRSPREALALAASVADAWSARATLPLIGPRARHANYGAVTNSMRQVAKALIL